MPPAPYLGRRLMKNFCRTYTERDISTFCQLGRRKGLCSTICCFVELPLVHLDSKVLHPRLKKGLFFTLEVMSRAQSFVPNDAQVVNKPSYQILWNLETTFRLD